MVERAPPPRGEGGTGYDHSPGHDSTTQLAERLDLGVPNDLRALRAWLVWRAGPRDPATGKFDKVPHYVSGEKRSGKQGRPEDREKLTTFDVALARLREGGYDGLGLAMLGWGIIGLDFDRCRDAAGVVAPWVLDLCHDTYAETSPSGTGVRAFYRGDFADRKNHAAHIEVFCRTGFLTVTGARLNGCDPAAMPEAVAGELLRRLGPDRARSDSAEVLREACARDPILARLKERGMVLRDLGGGRFDIRCPFEESHSTPGGASDTAYFAPNTGGYPTGNFSCLHSHCAERQQSEFRAALGLGEDPQDSIARLAALSPLEYDRAREAEAERLGVRLSTLDAEVQKAREAMDPSGGASLQGQAVIFDDPEPWPDEVDGEKVLNGVSDTLTNYLGQPDGAADAMALWAAHAHCHMAFLHTPRLNITAPEKNCGKTLTLDVLHSLVPKAIRTEGITTAVLFRIVDKCAPTLLVDEYDAFIHDNEELRGAFNAGHKRGGVHLRCEGDKNEVRGFRTFAPVALAGIRDLPGTLADRAIIIHMQRLAPGEQRAPFDSRRTEAEKTLCRKLTRWTRDNFQKLEAADPEMPAGAGHRVRDNWRPLFAIADRAGGDWPARVRRAFVLLGKPDDAVQSRAEMLLSDFRDMFAKHGDRILSAAAVGYLVEMEERPWPEYSRGKPITARQVAALLRRFGIKPNVLRAGEERARGYDKADFNNAFARYLPPVGLEGGDPIRDTVTMASGRHSSDFTSVTTEEPVTDGDPPQPAPRLACHGVTDRKGGSEADSAHRAGPAAARECPRCGGGEGQGCKWCGGSGRLADVIDRFYADTAPSSVETAATCPRCDGEGCGWCKGIGQIARVPGGAP